MVRCRLVVGNVSFRVRVYYLELTRKLQVHSKLQAN
ncbi:MAG: hypothetical protein ACI9G1_004239 [Pirellulaceae bacterium]|jgi:hypothetical protein